MIKHSFTKKVLRTIVLLAEERNMKIDQFIVDDVKQRFDHDISDMLGLDIRKPIHRKYIHITDSNANPMNVPREPRYREK